MDTARRQLRQRQLDRLFETVSVPPAPQGGWIRAIREALGLSLDDMAQRLGLASRTTAHQLERAEVNETLTLRRLRVAADALGCDLAVVVIPRRPLSEASNELEREAAEAAYRRINHSMALEGQMVAEDRVPYIAKLAEKRNQGRE